MLLVVTEKFEWVHFETADALMAALTPSPRLVTHTTSPNFIFRGHCDESWLLVPKALRLENAESGQTEALARIEDRLPATADNQVFAEYLLLRNFFDACDRGAIAIPGDSPQFRREYLNHASGLMEQALKEPHLWPLDEHFAALAFAQHHGLPTRLMDWSRNAVTGAYFAAEGVLRKKNTNNITIWALNIERLHLYKNIEVVAMPGANSARLGAQRGLFTCIRLPAQRGKPIGDPSLPTALSSFNDGGSPTSPLWRLTVPHAEGLRLLYLCHVHGVDGSTVYPGPAGAAMAALERSAWLRDDPETGICPAKLRPLVTSDITSKRME